jgi:hypothetical protein
MSKNYHTVENKRPSKRKTYHPNTVVQLPDGALHLLRQLIVSMFTWLRLHINIRNFSAHRKNCRRAAFGQAETLEAVSL